MRGETLVRFASLAAAVALAVGCASAGMAVRKRAASEFGCPVDQVLVDSVASGFVATGCEKEARYEVVDGRVTRRSAITRGPPSRPPLPIDRIPGTSSLGIE